MSGQAEANHPGEEKQEGLSKYIRRVRTALRRTSTAPKTTSEPSNTHVPEDESSKDTTAPKAQAPAPVQKPISKPATQPATVDRTTESTSVPHWSAIQQDKARALFAKYGLTLEPGEWRSPSDMTVQRVAKPIRMRVRRTCHRCQTTYGPDRVCVNCQHVRCKKCPRHPTPKDKEQSEGAIQFRTRVPERKGIDRNGPDVAPVQRKSRDPPLTIPSRTGGQDLIRRPIRQRVRRTCHRCNTTFGVNSTECENCNHVRCKKCPRDPPKLDKYPDGYPGDADPPIEPPERVWRKPRQRVRYSCHECSTVLKSKETACSSCGVEKGPETKRHPPKRVKPEPDPETVKRVQNRLAKLEISI
ncbi:hypothetical protein MW887_002392 [Aspergillus wentii]|nr:hypothetical protein MW887_002392 [Aspergillus wentii]